MTYVSFRQFFPSLQIRISTTTSEWPPWQAKCSGVLPSASLQETQDLFFSTKSFRILERSTHENDNIHNSKEPKTTYCSTVPVFKKIVWNFHCFYSAILQCLQQLHPVSNTVHTGTSQPPFLTIFVPHLQLFKNLRYSRQSPIITKLCPTNLQHLEATYSWSFISFLNTFYEQALALLWSLFQVNSLLVTKDMLWQKLPITFGSQ